MATTRIVLLNMARMQREILENSLSSADLEVRAFSEPIGLVEAARRSEAEFVIAEAGRFAPEEVCDLLAKCPDVKVLAVSKTGRQALLYELRPHRVPLGDLSSGALVAMIRSRRSRDGARRSRSAPREVGSTRKRR